MLDYLKTELHSLSFKQKLGLRYLRLKNFALLESMPEHLDELENPDMAHRDSAVSEFYADMLDKAETWQTFHKASPEWSRRMEDLKKFWDSQKSFVLCSNRFLLDALNTTLQLLEHLEKARQELKKRGFLLPKSFAVQYALYLKRLISDAHHTRKRIVYAMFGRLKTAYIHANLALNKKSQMDDVLFYVLDQLHEMGAVEMPPLQSTVPRTTLNGYYHTQFYYAVKCFGKTQEEKEHIDTFHWSNNDAARNLLFLTLSESNKSDSYGFIRVKTGKYNQVYIAIPAFLKHYLPSRRRYPAWIFREEHKILGFWEKQQVFLYKLYQLHDKPEQLPLYQALLSQERQKLAKARLPLMAFNYKNMLKAWQHCLQKLYEDSVIQKRILDNTKNSVSLEANNDTQNKCLNLYSETDKKQDIKNLISKEVYYKKWNQLFYTKSHYGRKLAPQASKQEFTQHNIQSFH